MKGRGRGAKSASLSHVVLRESVRRQRPAGARQVVMDQALLTPRFFGLAGSALQPRCRGVHASAGSAPFGASASNSALTLGIGFTNWASLLRHHFVDPDARYERVALRHLFCVFKAAGAHDREAGDRFKSHWQVLGSRLRDFSASTEMPPHVDDMVFHFLEPPAPGCPDFLPWLFQSVVQQDKLLHCRLLDVG